MVPGPLPSLHAPLLLLLLPLLLAARAIRASAADVPPRAEVRIGAQFPIYKASSSGGEPVEDSGGRRRQAAFVLAMQHLEDKQDGFWDDILPATNLSVSFYDSKRDSGRAVINAFTMWNVFKAEVTVGPASSGPSKLSQQIFRLPDLSVPQISYSATSETLSDISASPLFLRTPPSDAFQANIIVAMIQAQGWRFACMLSGTDPYSAAGSQATISQLDERGLTLRAFATFETGTSSVADEVRQLKDADCRLVVLWAQWADIDTVGKEALAQGFASSSPTAPVLWFVSETFLGTFENVCGSVTGAQMCSQVFKGALLVTPSYGPGTESYANISRAWHAQTARVGAPDRTNIIGCDMSVDASNQTVWQSDHDLDPSTPRKCTAVNFTEYDRVSAAAMLPEQGQGDGRISTYVPYAYDAMITVALGLHGLFTSRAWRDGEVDWSAPAVRGRAIYEHMLNVSFDGFSGSVRFRRRGGTANDKFEGDRDASAVSFLLWNYDGTLGGAFENVGDIGANGVLRLAPARSLTWPADTKPDDRPVCDKAAGDLYLILHACDPMTGRIALDITHDADLCKGTNQTETVPCQYAPVSSSEGIAVVVLSCLCGTIQLAGLIWLVRAWRQGDRVIKLSQPAFLAIFNAGLFLMGLSPILFLGKPSDVLCLVRVNVSIALIWAPLVVKMYRVWRLFENKKMEKRTGLTRAPMLRMVLRMILFEIFLLAVMSAVPSWRSRAVTRPADVLFTTWNPTGSVVAGMCMSAVGGGGEAWMAIQTTVHVGAVGFVAALAYQVRNAPASFQESKWLGLIGMNVFSLGGVVGAVYFLMSADLPYPNLVLLQCVGTFVICLVALMLMHVPKYLESRGEGTDVRPTRNQAPSRATVTAKYTSADATALGEVLHASEEELGNSSSTEKMSAAAATAGAGEVGGEADKV